MRRHRSAGVSTCSPANSFLFFAPPPTGRYRYFARTLDEKETTLIGDIKPKKLDGSEVSSA